MMTASLSPFGYLQRNQRQRDVREPLPTLPGYVTVTVLFDKPTKAALEAFLAADWSPEKVAGNDQVIYVGFANAARTKLTMEKALSVSGTARTPATLRKLLA